MRPQTRRFHRGSKKRVEEKDTLSKEERKGKKRTATNQNFPTSFRGIFRLTRGSQAGDAVRHDVRSLDSDSQGFRWNLSLRIALCATGVSVWRRYRLTGRSFEHRRQWVEDRIHELAGIFGVAIWGYAVIGNHLHVVVQTLPETVNKESK